MSTENHSEFVIPAQAGMTGYMDFMQVIAVNLHRTRDLLLTQFLYGKADIESFEAEQ